MGYNINAGYGRLVAQSATPKGTGKTFYVTANGGATQQYLQDVFMSDYDGVGRVYSTITSALASTVAGRGDVILIAPDFTTAPTDTELGTAGTNGVRIEYATQDYDEQIVMTTNKSLPATTSGTLFNVVGVVEIIAIIGVVTTVIQAQSCNLKLSTVSNSATTDVCANLDINGHLAQSRYSITGTFANALINTAKGVPVARQATSFIAQEGTITATTSATNTGAIRWIVRYKPMQEGARIYAA